MKLDIPAHDRAGRTFRAIFRGAVLAVTALLIQASVSFGLLPFDGQRAEAAFKAVYLANLEGTYAVDGRNTDGSRYSGRVFITVQGDTAHFRWEIAGQTYRGQGTLNGTFLTVDWGAQDPVVYQVNPDGSMDGVWAGGRASERLVRLK